jgi:hypothetical protein
VGIIVAKGNWLQDENFECAMRRNWILLKFQKQKDLLKRREREEGLNEV